MSGVIGWIGLFLMTYILLGQFLVATGVKKALSIASTNGEFQSEAKVVLVQNHRARLHWIKRHRAQLPIEARPIAAWVATLDFSCWVALAVLFILYAFQGVAP